MKKKMSFVSMLVTFLCCIFMVACGGQQKTLTGISVAKGGDKTFEVGHELTLEDFADLTVVVEYSDETQNKTLSLDGVAALPDGLSIDMLGQAVIAGDNTVTVTYSEGDASKSDTFTIRGVVPEYSVTCSSEGVTVNGPTKVKKGEDLSFTVVINEGYRIADEGLKVFANDTALTATDEKYTLSNVQNDVVIVVSGVEPIPEIKSVAVQVPEAKGVVFTGEKTAEVGSDYVFSIEIESGYTKTEEFCVKVNGVEVTEVDGKYTLSNVQDDLVIVVVGVELIPEINSVAVHAPETKGIVFTGKKTAEVGSDYVFSIEIESGYTKTEEFCVKVNGVEVTAVDGKYTVSNVQDDVVIVVVGVEAIPESVTVHAPATEGVSFAGAATVEVGSDYVFSIEIKSGYTKTEGFCVKVNGVELTEIDGKYVVQNVSEELTITVTGVELRTLKVEFEGEGFIPPQNVTVQFGNTYYFSVAVDPTYSDSANQIKVYVVNGSEKTELIPLYGTYAVENVVDDVRISVEGLTRNTYTVTPPETLGIAFSGADSVVAGDTYAFGIQLKEGFFAGADFEVYALCGGEKVVATKNGETGNYEFVVSGQPVIYVDGVYKNIIDIAMAQWPDANSIEVTESDDVPDGYTKAYAFKEGWQWGYRRNLANVDISEYSKVSFMIKATDLQDPASFHLYQGDTFLKNFYYADTDWHEIVLTQNAEGVWSMTAGGEEITAFSSTAINLKDMFNLSLGNTQEAAGESHFVVTNIIGVPLPVTIKAGYEEVIGIAMAQWPADNSIEVTESDDIPKGYTKAYAFKEGWQWGYRRNLADVDISGYSTVSFMIKATDLKNPANFHLFQGDTYLKNFYYADTDWHEIVLTKNAEGVWSMTAGGDAVAAFSSTATNLKDMFNLSLGNTQESDGESHFVVTNIIGVKDTSVS